MNGEKLGQERNRACLKSIEIEKGRKKKDESLLTKELVSPSRTWEGEGGGVFLFVPQNRGDVLRQKARSVQTEEGLAKKMCRGARQEKTGPPVPPQKKRGGKEDVCQGQEPPPSSMEAESKKKGPHLQKEATPGGTRKEETQKEICVSPEGGSVSGERG